MDGANGARYADDALDAAELKWGLLRGDHPWPAIDLDVRQRKAMEECVGGLKGGLARVVACEKPAHD